MKRNDEVYPELVKAVPWIRTTSTVSVGFQNGVTFGIHTPPGPLLRELRLEGIPMTGPEKEKPRMCFKRNEEVHVIFLQLFRLFYMYIYIYTLIYISYLIPSWTQ